MQGRLPRAALTAALAIYGVSCLARPERWRLLDGVHLAIHESGHLVFAPFGETLMFLGGTLLQLLVPLAFVVAFVRRGDPHAGSVALWWVAMSGANVSVYVADARAQLLPLVGGGEHDWFHLLDGWGLLHADQAIARGVHVASVAVFVLSLAWGAWSLRRRPEEPDAALEPALAAALHDRETRTDAPRRLRLR